MSQSGPFLGFSLRDTLTRLVPGLLFLAPVTIGIAIFIPSIVPEGSLFYILFALAAYILGELIDQLRAGLFRVPMSFRYFIYKETDQMGKMPRWYIRIVEFQERLPNRINFYEDRGENEHITDDMQFDFREDIESELGVDFVDTRPRDIYDLLLIYLDDHLTPRLRRMQSVSIFSTNLRIASGGALIVYTIYALFNWGDPFFWSIWGLSLLIVLFVVVLWSVLTLTQRQYSELLFKEYYMKRQEDQKDQ